MLSSIELKSFQKNGYLIKKSNDIKSLNNIQNLVSKYLKKNKRNKISNSDYFKKLHKFVKKSELNSFRIGAINLINKNSEFRDLYYNSARELLDGLVGNEIAMQKKINLSIQMPHDNKSMLPMHSDIYAGESPFEVVVWIPLMDVRKSTHSMFITNPKHNVIINREITKNKNSTILSIFNKHKNKFKFLKINYGEILIFSPIIQHGNVVNTTKETRVSLNCRFKSLLSPYDVFSKTHRNIPHFFKPYSIKPLTKIGFSFIDAVNKKKFHGSL